jgi:hypothetical protein
MIVSQMTASLVCTLLFDAVASGHVADTQTKICLVFQWNSEEKSAEREKRMEAYSSFLVE